MFSISNFILVFFLCMNSVFSDNIDEFGGFVAYPAGNPVSSQLKPIQWSSDLTEITGDASLEPSESGVITNAGLNLADRTLQILKKQDIQDEQLLNGTILVKREPGDASSTNTVADPKLLEEITTLKRKKKEEQRRLKNESKKKKMESKAIKNRAKRVRDLAKLIKQKSKQLEAEAKAVKRDSKLLKQKSKQLKSEIEPLRKAKKKLKQASSSSLNPVQNSCARM